MNKSSCLALPDKSKDEAIPGGRQEPRASGSSLPQFPHSLPRLALPGPGALPWPASQVS